MNFKAFALSALTALSPTVLPAYAGNENTTDSLAQGKYLARIGGCHDCHTPGFAEAGGQAPESQWLVGSPVGFQGPWGTSYPTNLRRYMADLTEQQWLARARQPMRPPMPWFNLKVMSDPDLVALYRYIRALGPTGTDAPAAAAPGLAVATPYIDFTPKNLPALNSLPATHAAH